MDHESLTKVSNKVLRINEWLGNLESRAFYRKEVGRKNGLIRIIDFLIINFDSPLTPLAKIVIC